MRPLADYRDFEAFIRRFTNYERAVPPPAEGLDAFKLDRMRSLHAAAGEPPRSCPIVHVAGTKGKGSTVLLLEALLEADGLRVGAYTSPHVEHLRERIRLDGHPASETEVVAVTNSLLPLLAAREGDPGRFPTFFELLTLVALEAFERRQVDVALLEVGLGGRLDATNVVRPLLTAITSIGLEHTRLLGSSVEEIAAEKAGIIKPGVPVVIGPLPLPADRVVAEIARRQVAPLRRVGPDAVRPLPDGRLEAPSLPGPLDPGPARGPGLRSSLAIALTLRELLHRASGRSTPELPADALARAALPGRVEVFEGRPPVLVDGAHTVESLASLAAAVEEIGWPRPRTLLFAVAEDKDRSAMRPILDTLAEHAIFTRADAARGVDPETLRTEAGRGHAIEDPEEALHAALRSGHPVIACGSLYLAGAVRPALRRRRQAGAGGHQPS